jgi:hypothetical protein
VPIQWEEVSVTPILKGGKTVIPDNAIQSVKKNTVALKGTQFPTFFSKDAIDDFGYCIEGPLATPSTPPRFILPTMY